MNIFEDIPERLQEELFEDIIVSQNIKIQRIVSDGHTTKKGSWYESSQNEWVIIIQGNATITFEDENDTILNVGEYINIPMFKKHRVSSTSKDEKTIWLAIHY